MDNRNTISYVLYAAGFLLLGYGAWTGGTPQKVIAAAAVLLLVIYWRKKL